MNKVGKGSVVRNGVAVVTMFVAMAGHAAESAFVSFPLAYAQASENSNPPAKPSDTGEPADPKASDAPKKESLWTTTANGKYLSFVFDYRHPLTGDYDAYYGGRLMMEMWATPRHAIGIGFGIGTLDYKSGSVPDRGAHSPTLFDVGAFYRLFFTPPHVFLRPYGSLHLNLGTMVVDYRADPISDDDEIWRDNLGYADAAAGMGLLFNFSKSCHGFVEMNYGGMAFLDTTYWDLENRLFDDFGYVTLKTGFGFTF